MDQSFEIRKSGIAGNGAFAIRMIPKGETVCFLTGESCNLDEMIRRVNEGLESPADPLQVDLEEYLDLDELPRTFNHSCSPNAFVRGRNELTAMCDIGAGEEIVFDYSTTMNDNERKIADAGRELWTCECACGSDRCRGTIDQFRTLPEASRTFYVRNGYMPDFMLKVFGR